MVRMYLAVQKATKLPKDPDLAFCYTILNNVSRSFAVVIQQLPNPLRDAICVFYLVLRGLDTVEDDMSIPVKEKLPMLLDFHNMIFDREFNMSCGTGHYKDLMAQFGTVVNAFLELDEPFKVAITDATKKMGAGMAEFIEKEVKTIADYDKYCHYVAGLVGIGLSNLFASSGLESEEFTMMDDLSNHMGLFLQKTNIIRDYLEDIMEEPAPRMFWPRAIWGKYASQLEDFKDPANSVKAVECLNNMILDALRHLPYCIKYMAHIRTPSVFRFAGIPQIMAIGTLALCYNNPTVFSGVVKMRRGETARVFDSCSNLGDLLRWFAHFLAVLKKKVATEVDGTDPTLQEMRATIQSHTSACRTALQQWELQQPYLYARRCAARVLAIVLPQMLLLLFAFYFYFAWHLGSTPLPAVVQAHLPSLAEPHNSTHRALSAMLLVGTVSYLLGNC